jgi:uncharacterized membrane protein YhdT
MVLVLDVVMASFARPIFTGGGHYDTAPEVWFTIAMLLLPVLFFLILYRLSQQAEG